MTILIQRAATTKFCLTDLDLNAIYPRLTKTYKFVFISDQTKEELEVSLVPSINNNRYTFTFVEPTDLEFINLGFYTYQVYEVENGTLDENLLHEGKMKFIEVRTMPPTVTPPIKNTYVAYGN